MTSREPLPPSRPPRPLIIATRNSGKLREFRRLLSNPAYTILSLDDRAVELEVEETGATFEENAVLKAKAYADATGELTIADDSGLEVDALSGEPGIRSARYAGGHGDDEANNRLLLQTLADVPGPRRTARYRVVLALADPAGGEIAVHTVDGSCDGLIAAEPAGERGFGYDPLFYVPRYNRTMAQLTPREKDSISHRGIAARKMAQILADITRP